MAENATSSSDGPRPDAGPPTAPGAATPGGRRDMLRLAREEATDWRMLSRRLENDRRIGLLLLMGGLATQVFWALDVGFWTWLLPLIGVCTLIIGFGLAVLGREDRKHAQEEAQRWTAIVARVEQELGEKES